MNKNLFLAICCVIALAFASCSTLRPSKRLPAISEIAPILDSIVTEGFQLYYSERANWIATDQVFERYQPNQLGSSVSFQPDKDTWTVAFFDQNNENCLMECRFNIISNHSIFLDSVRPITTSEKELLRRKQTMLDEAIDRYGSEMSFAPSSFGEPNVDIVQFTDKLTRLYFMQGTIKPNVIPFGNDYSIDFDENLQPIAFRRYHRSLIDCPTINEKGEEVRMTWHSHLQDNPFITPTDICNFLLYRPDNMFEFCVVSTAYGRIFTFNVAQRRILIQ